MGINVSIVDGIVIDAASLGDLFSRQETVVTVARIIKGEAGGPPGPPGPSGYTHPSYHSARMIVTDPDRRFMTDIEKKIVADIGEIAKRIRNRGLWCLDTLEPYLNDYKYQDQVYHSGCAWLCVTSETTAEPKWDSVDWLMSHGNGEMSIQFKATQGFQFKLGSVSGEFEARVYHGATDITADVINTADFNPHWTRNSNRPADDLVWIPTMGSEKNILVLANHDMPTNFHLIRSVEFKCVMYVPVRSEIKELTASLGLKM